MGERIGILGGSFNPVHNGHIRLAIEVLERLSLDSVEFVPAAVPPHKSGVGMLPFSERYRLVTLAVKDVPGLAANPVESKRSGPSFTLDTLAAYRAERPEAEIFFIMGTGTFLEVPTWHRGKEIADMASLVAVNRWNIDVEDVERLMAAHWPDAERESESVWRFAAGTRLHCLSVPRLDIKAAAIRDRWRQHKRLTALVPPLVEQAIAEGGAVYQDSWGHPSDEGWPR